jgi:hypothetical protein
MLKGEKISTPYFNSFSTSSLETNGKLIDSSSSSSSVAPSTSMANYKDGLILSTASSLSLAANALNQHTQPQHQQQATQKVTRRRVHEITEKRKQEEQESESHKKVKTEGDAPESLIKQLVKQVESEQANVQNDVNKFF